MPGARGIDLPIRQFGCVLAARWIGLPLIEARNFALGTVSLSMLGHDPHHPEVAVKAHMAGRISAPALVAAINRCERALRTAFPQVRWLFFEPDVES